MRTTVPVLLLTTSGLMGQAPTPGPAPAPAQPPKLDKGLLDPAWFGPEATFIKGVGADFLWMRPGLRLAGRTLHLGDWADPVMLRPGAEGRDLAAATRLTDLLPPILRGAFQKAFRGRAACSRSAGDVLVEVRIVDARDGSHFGSRMTTASGFCISVTWDLKLLRASDRQLLLAAHHRSVLGGIGPISPIEERFTEWADTFATWLAQAALRESDPPGVN